MAEHDSTIPGQTGSKSGQQSQSKINEPGLNPTTDSSLPLAGETVAFTGTLASMVHREAASLVEQYGGRSTHSVSSTTSMLVVGEEGWPLEEDGHTSRKLQHAMQLIADGQGLQIVAESDWLHLLGLNERRDEIHRAYTPAMLSRLLDVPVRLIRRWARLGLIRPVRRVCRLPYFEYREVASARRLAALLEEGISAKRIEQSLGELGQTLAGTDRSLAQLNLLVQDKHVLMRDAHGVLNPRTGQRLLDFENVERLNVIRPEEENLETVEIGTQDSVNQVRPIDGGVAGSSDESPVSFSIMEARLTLGDRSMSDWTADEWFHEGCRLAEESEFESAVNAFRNSMSLLVSEQLLLRDDLVMAMREKGGAFPDPADVNFHLADALYRSGRLDAAIERYHSAIEFAPDFIEAWTQLGCLNAELKRPEAAEDALLTAISIHPGNPDALLHYAQLLDQQQRPEEAASWWEQYLQHDSRGPWADHARQRLSDMAVRID
ncbi:MAG: tetratricopeptide repeat protein [Planctomycetaceae bacterium]|nr:tetratricopeptide repeat protein [Planctomycetaceae bacterium]